MKIHQVHPRMLIDLLSRKLLLPSHQSCAGVLWSYYIVACSLFRNNWCMHDELTYSKMSHFWNANSQHKFFFGFHIVLLILLPKKCYRYYSASILFFHWDKNQVVGSMHEWIIKKMSFGFPDICIINFDVFCLVISSSINILFL